MSRTAIALLMLAILGVFVADKYLLHIFSCADQAACDEAARKASIDEEKHRALLRRLSESAVSFSIHDGRAVEFRNVFNSPRDRTVICGLVKIRKYSGAVTEFSPFIVDKHVWFATDGTPDFSRKWSHYCGD